MNKLVPSIYFYTASLIGLVILIIGLFADIHYVVNISSGPNYPLLFGIEQRCLLPAQPVPPGVAQKYPSTNPSVYQDCIKSVEAERVATQRADLEKALSYTVVGLIVFSLHFYYARRKLS